ANWLAVREAHFSLLALLCSLRTNSRTRSDFPTPEGPLKKTSRPDRPGSPNSSTAAFAKRFSGSGRKVSLTENNGAGCRDMRRPRGTDRERKRYRQSWQLLILSRNPRLRKM